MTSTLLDCLQTETVAEIGDTTSNLITNSWYWNNGTTGILVAASVDGVLFNTPIRTGGVCHGSGLGTLVVPLNK